MDFFNLIKNKRLLILLISIILNIVLIILLIYLGINHDDCICNNTSNDNINTQENISDDFYVEVKGSVKKPGVYKFNSNNIINDLITASGGFNKNAYTKNINLSKSLSKELVVYVYTKDEYKKSKKSDNNPKEISVCNCSTYDIDNCTDNYQSEIVASNTDSVYSVDSNDNKSSLVNINTATIDELQTLSGIGLSKAKDIIEYRTNNGLFKDISEITNVSGIGSALYEKIKNNITI